MQVSRSQSGAYSIPIGTIDLSLIINVPINGFLMLIPEDQNRLIKKIEYFLFCDERLNVLSFHSMRLRIRNRDVSINTNLAGNILNPISGAFDASTTKDSICDIVLTSKKNYIEFNQPIKAGGLQFQTIRLKFNNATTVNSNIRFYIGITYE